MSEEENGYRIVDKRYQADSDDGQGNEELEPEQPDAEPAEAAAAEETESAGEPAGEHAEERSEAVADVYSVAKWVIGIMAATAWQYMGLQVNPATGTIEKDLIQARIAVDTVVFLGDKINPHLNEAERREIRFLISDLQVNFVQQNA